MKKIIITLAIAIAMSVGVATVAQAATPEPVVPQNNSSVIETLRPKITPHNYFIDINSCGDLAYGRSLVVGPEGDVIHQAGDAQEIIPVIVDFARVRRTRRNGSLGMAQPLKSFRDAEHAFPPYAKGAFSRPLESLGDLEMPGAGTKKSRPEADLSVPRIAQGG